MIIMILLPLLLLAVPVVDAAVPAYFLKGNKLSCTEEGQLVVIPFLKQDPCITCMCLNSEIDCFKNTCTESLNCAYYSHSNQSDSCCRKCRHCALNGGLLANSEQVLDKHDPCTTYHCNSGTLTTYQSQCYVPCKNPIPLLGQCCPSCNACPRRNTKNGQEVVGFYPDPCISCHCFKGQMICKRKICPVLPCPQSKWYKAKHACCPICKGTEEVKQSIDSKSCLFNGKVLAEDDRFQYDKCTTCVCRNATVVCHKQPCRSLTCAEQVKAEGQCCPHCAAGHQRQADLSTDLMSTLPLPPPQVIAECRYKRQVHKNGDQWKEDCSECTCKFGQVKCAPLQCPEQFVCPFGHRKVKVNGECCESCVREDSRCVIQDQMHNITTYDQLNYRWEGRCNYVLTRDCERKRFSVHLVNKFRNSSSGNVRFEGHSLMVKLESNRVYLSHLGRVRVNRSLVRLPYVQIGHFSISQTKPNTIRLRAMSGVEIVWTVNRSAEVKLKSHFQDQTCGLCGNFNLDPEDEFRAKRTKQVTSLAEFANSFKVGQNILCPKVKRRGTLNKKSIVTDGCKSADDRLVAGKICARMRQRYPRCVAGNVDALHRRCLSAVCACGGDKQCQCLALEDFINNCNSSNGKFLQTSMCKSFNCPAGSEFKFCSYNCRKTCKNRGEIGQCRRTRCKSGCECIGNRVWHQSHCIPDVMCPSVV